MKFWLPISITNRVGGTTKTERKNIMKIGIIVYSQTGNTLSVAEELKAKLLAGGNLVSLEQVSAINKDATKIEQVQLANKPDVSTYDMLVFAAPVQGFSLSPVMNAYLSGITSLKGKKVGCFVTHFFPYAWMGGNRTVGQMKKICESKGANIYETGVVNWSSSHRKNVIADTVEKLSKI